MLLSCPTVSVFDPDGSLPLKLDRQGLSRVPLSFNRELGEDIARDVIAYALADPSDFKPRPNALPQAPQLCDHPALLASRYKGYVCLGNGFTLQDGWVISRLGLRSIVFIQPFPEGAIGPLITNEKSALIRGADRYYKIPDIEEWVRDALRTVGDTMPLWGIFVTGVRILTHKQSWSKWKTRISKYYREGCEIEEEHEKLVSIVKGKCDVSGCNLNTVASWLSENSDRPEWGLAPTLIEYFISQELTSREPSIIGKIFTDEVGGLVIPYDLEERGLKFATGLLALTGYIEAHRESRRNDAADKSNDADAWVS